MASASFCNRFTAFISVVQAMFARNIRINFVHLQTKSTLDVLVGASLDVWDATWFNVIQTSSRSTWHGCITFSVVIWSTNDILVSASGGYWKTAFGRVVGTFFSVTWCSWVFWDVFVVTFYVLVSASGLEVCATLCFVVIQTSFTYFSCVVCSVVSWSAHNILVVTSCCDINTTFISSVVTIVTDGSWSKISLSSTAFNILVSASLQVKIATWGGVVGTSGFFTSNLLVSFSVVTWSANDTLVSACVGSIKTTLRSVVFTSTVTSSRCRFVGLVW
jgi:hypothetical protein